MGSDHGARGEAGGRSPAITYHHPEEPRDEQPVVAALVTVGGQEFPLTVQRLADDVNGSWSVRFGDLADEGRYATFDEALRAAHDRVERDAAELARALRDGGY